MRRPVALLLSSLIVATASTLVEHSIASAATATVAGVVTDTSGNPIAGATVVAQREPNVSFGLTATSGPDGHYAISGLSDGSWKVVASAPGYGVRFGNAARWEDGASIDVTADGTVAFDVILPRNTASISGTVVDPDGNRLPAVQVSVAPAVGWGTSFFVPVDFSSLFRTVVTDEHGEYRVDNLAVSAFSVGFSPRYFGETGATPPTPYVAESYPDVHEGPGSPILTSEDTLTSAIDALLDRGATISGLVTDSDGTPLPGISVYTASVAEFGGVATDTDGRYTLIGVPSGQTQLYAFEETGRSAFYHEPGALDPALIELDLDTTYEGFDIQFEATGSVYVTVLDSLGRPNQGGMVACRDPGVPEVVDFPIPGWGDDVVCTTGAVNPSFQPSNGVTLPVGTYNAVGQKGARGFNVELVLSAQTTFTVIADTPLDCTFVLEGPASCAPTDPDTLDGDSVAAVVEDRAPNGDGNGDGIRDATQSNVTSVPSYLDDGFVTFVVDPNLHITFASIAEPSGTFFMPETGSMRVRIGGLPLGGATELTILRTNVGPADELSSYDYSGSGFPTRQPLPADFDGNTIVAHLVDGDGFDAPWDSTGPNVADGSITLDAVPVVGDHAPPVITCPSPAPTFQVGGFGVVRATVTDVGSGVAGSAILEKFVFPQSIGTSSVTFNASDLAGNSTSQSCEYIVVGVPVDNVPPTIQCFATPTFEVGQFGSVQAFAFDNVGIVGPSFLSQLADTSQPGTFAVTFSASDVAGNSTTTDCPYVVLAPPPLDLTPPTIVCPDAPEYQIGQFAILVATAFDDVAPLQQTVYQYPDTSAEGEFSVTVYAADYAGNTASEDCPYRVAGDRDDVESAVEDGAPNGGDGNADGIPDRNQPYVTSLPEPDGDGYVTLVNAFNAQQHLVSSSTVADAGATPPGIDLVGGAYDVRLDYPYASLYVARSEAPVNPQLAAWDGTEWTRWPGFVFDGDALDLDGPFNSTVTLRIAPAEIDSTPPDIECASGTPQFLLNDPGASISVAVSDDDSGVESPVVTVPVDAHSLGDHWASVVAGDRIGNMNFAFCPYRVGVDVEVMDPDRVVMGKAGKVIPIEWRASDFNGDSVDDVGHFLSISTVPVACPHGRLVLAGNSASGGPTLDSGNTWRYGVTAPTQKGCYTVTVHAVGDDASAVIRVT